MYWSPLRWGKGFTKGGFFVYSREGSMTIRSTYELDQDTGEFTRKDFQDVNEILKSNMEERNSGDNDSRKADMRKVASIPMVVLEALKTRDFRDGGPIDFNLVGYDPDHSARFARWLNDRDNVGFRTNKSRQGV